MDLSLTLTACPSPSSHPIPVQQLGGFPSKGEDTAVLAAEFEWIRVQCDQAGKQSSSPQLGAHL